MNFHHQPITANNNYKYRSGSINFASFIFTCIFFMFSDNDEKKLICEKAPKGQINVKSMVIDICFL
jgi:hypothetical protein